MAKSKYDTKPGMSFNDLTALRPSTEKIKYPHRSYIAWDFECICGNIKAYPPSDVWGGRAKSCGCAKARANRIKANRIKETYHLQNKPLIELDGLKKDNRAMSRTINTLSRRLNLFYDYVVRYEKANYMIDPKVLKKQILQFERTNPIGVLNA